MKNNIKFLLSDMYCTLFKIGNSKYMPGTLGSFVGLLIGIILKVIFPLATYIFIIIIITITAIIMINIYQRTAGKEDRSEIIIDEFIGQQIPLFFIEISVLNIILVFVLFRFFDIFKIFPSNYIDKNYKSSFGIIADDLIAGIQATALILLLSFII
jgi:phosphatidylglycerophosphatase A